MILCLALGIANIFTFNVLIIIFCALCMYVPAAIPNHHITKSKLTGTVIEHPP